MYILFVSGLGSWQEAGHNTKPLIFGNWNRSNCWKLTISVLVNLTLSFIVADLIELKNLVSNNVYTEVWIDYKIDSDNITVALHSFGL